MTITTDDGKPCEGLEQGPFEPIAVIGVAAMMPDAPDLDTFWQNIIDSHVSIREVREGRWPAPPLSKAFEVLPIIHLPIILLPNRKHVFVTLQLFKILSGLSHLPDSS